MKRLAPLLLAALAAAGCSKTSTRPGARLNGPVGLAVYSGYSLESPGTLRPYVAVANTLADELRLVDAVTDQVVVAPSLVLALAVPTESRPSLVVSGSLHDVDGAGAPLAGPDLLLVAPQGLVPRDATLHPGELGAAFQVVVTWDAQTRVDRIVDLADAAPGAALVSLAIGPLLRTGTGGPEPTPGAARVYAGLSDGTLLTLDAQRGAGGAITLAPPVAQALQFEPLDLALSPDGTRLYAASGDPIPGPGGAFGVAELDVTGAAGAFAVRALPARAPTTQVMAADLELFQDWTADPRLDVFGPTVRRVYAAIDPSACGRDRAMACGIAVLDPVAGGLAADPAGEHPYHVPIQVTGTVIEMVATRASALATRPGLLEVNPASGLRWTTALAAVATTDGRVYLADLGHFGVANNVTSLTGTTRTRVVGGVSIVQGESAVNPPPTLGVWGVNVLLSNGATRTGVFIDSDMLATGLVGVTPGFTNSETIQVTWQGSLPGLESRQGLIHQPGAAAEWVAVQEATGLGGPGEEAWRGVGRVYDPRLGIHVGDIVEVSASAELCPLGAFELLVTAILPPTAATPGGALAVTPAPVQPTHPTTANPTPEPADPACLGGLGDTSVTLTVRAPELVAVGSSTGYIGRPRFIEDAPTAFEPFALRYENEDQLACAIMPDDRADWPPPPAAVAACEADAAACRAECERLVLARRARRLFYVNDWCRTGSSCRTDLWPTLNFPLPTGPAVSFKVGAQDAEGLPTDSSRLTRGTYFQVSLGSGFSPASRQPLTGTTVIGATMPGGVAWHDRAAFTGVAADVVHGFATFHDNAVIDFANDGTAQAVVTIR